ncbi:MAG TPA: DUF5693 family protein [Bacilli bacterium]
MKLYAKLNRIAAGWLWVIVLAGVVAALPLAANRMAIERSTDTVEFVFDYRDLLQISQFEPDPRAFVASELAKMQQIGIQALALYESTLEDFRLSGEISLYSAREAALLAGTAVSPTNNSTYVLFSDAHSAKSLTPVIESGFADYGVQVQPWTVANRPGLKIPLPFDESVMKPLEPDPIALNALHEKGFDIVPRLSDNRPFNRDRMEKMLAQFAQNGVKWVIFSGDRVTGYTDHAVPAMASLMQKYGIGEVIIEPVSIKTPQSGSGELAYLTDYRVIRLHSVLEGEAGQPADRLADRYILAAKDRNIRMIYLNAEASRNPDKAEFTNPLDNLYDSLTGPDGAIKRLQAAGFHIGQADPLQATDPSWQKPLRLVVVVGAVALIALALAEFFPSLFLALFALGLLGAAGLVVVAPGLLLQALALGVGVCAATLAAIKAIQALRRSRPATEQIPPPIVRIRRATGLLIMASAISLSGVALIVGLLNNVVYMLQIQQFRGVSLLHMLPIAAVLLYLLFFADGFRFSQAVAQARVILTANIKVWWALAAMIAGAGLLYYMSRTGNAGQTSEWERMLRSFLENTLYVRPRTKEFLFAHPLFVLGAYAAVKYPKALYLFVAGVIGQLSIVDTFAHIHTPLVISLIRVGYGVLFGAIIGICLIVVWEWLERLWRRWNNAENPS